MRSRSGTRRTSRVDAWATISGKARPTCQKRYSVNVFPEIMGAIVVYAAKRIRMGRGAHREWSVCRRRCSLYLSDCHFFNFGALVTRNATEHLIVIIDAGSRGICLDKHWKKSQINTTVMYKFWKACKWMSAENPQIQEMWKKYNYNDIEGCIDEATMSWSQYPFVTQMPMTTHDLWHAMASTEKFRRSTVYATSALKIMELVGRFSAKARWSFGCAVVCYRESEKLQSELISEQSKILHELYQRITETRTEEEALQDVMTFWGRLNEYRERMCRDMLHSSKEQPVTPRQASQMVEVFKYDQL